MCIIHQQQTRRNVAQRHFLVHQLTEPTRQLHALHVKLGPSGFHTVSGGLLHLRNNHPGEQTVQPLLPGKQIGVAPYAHRISSMTAQIVGMGMPYQQSVKQAVVLALTGKQTFVRAMPQQQNPLQRGYMIQQMFDFGIAPALVNQTGIRSLIESRQHRRSPVFRMYHQHNQFINKERALPCG